MHNNNQNRILADLTNRLNLICQADIKTDHYAIDILKELLEIDANIFTVPEWNDAYQYFSGKNMPYATEHEAKLGLMTFLSKERWHPLSHY